MSLEYFFNPQEDRWYHFRIDFDTKKIYCDGKYIGNYSEEVREKDELGQDSRVSQE